MNLIERVKNILLQPRETWAAIDAEATDVATLFTRYATVLAAIPAVVVIAAIVIGVVIAALGSLFTPVGGMAGATASIGMNTPGGGKVNIDTAGLEAAGKKMEEAARQMEQASLGQAIAVQSLKAALPETLGGLPRKAK
ncbi:MAG: hypothetical protein QM569_02960 [Acidovorax sp.]|uniref:hypothetical protein n=1 Tax=Acidovorax sp. TaxID=1872122 RepID=UPI0039E72B91